TNILSSFQPISLEEIESVSLMNRVDTKYVFNIKQLPEILLDASANYKILEINNVRQHLYDSMYFDTPDFQMYYKHLYNRLNRHKIRFRKYINSNGLTFLEIKFKNNKEKTFKKRKKYIDIVPYLPEELSEFLIHQTTYSHHQLLPSLKIQYYRITLVNTHLNERVTIDTQLQVDNFKSCYNLENVVIAEVKRSSYTERTPFLNLIRQHKIREGGLSKYCTGMAFTNPNLKKNNFLPKLKLFEKINSL
ncbi:MAG: polyphosphate polymerase domain-containing protein, partial [Bacteroidia bacterium]|nr:polyphosphate polymerase domain-containing protein [Bacteroidia bacterium]